MDATKASRWPAEWPEERLLQIRAQLGSAAFTALFQGRPAVLEGQIFRRDWWGSYREIPPLESIIISCDSAFKTGTSNDYSVLQAWGVAKTGYYLLDVFRRRVEFPELQRAAEAMAAKWSGCRALLIEDRASGQSLIQALQRETRLPGLAREDLG